MYRDNFDPKALGLLTVGLFYLCSCAESRLTVTFSSYCFCYCSWQWAQSVHPGVLSSPDSTEVSNSKGVSLYEKKKEDLIHYIPKLNHPRPLNPTEALHWPHCQNSDTAETNRRNPMTLHLDNFNIAGYFPTNPPACREKTDSAFLKLFVTVACTVSSQFLQNDHFNSS